jgi:hypothetical protein
LAVSAVKYINRELTLPLTEDSTMVTYDSLLIFTNIIGIFTIVSIFMAVRIARKEAREERERNR